MLSVKTFNRILRKKYSMDKKIDFSDIDAYMATLKKIREDWEKFDQKELIKQKVCAVIDQAFDEITEAKKEYDRKAVLEERKAIMLYKKFNLLL